jgi:hypothetical protein
MTASPGVFALDLWGGASMEKALSQRTRLRGVDYLWEQEGFDPLSRRIRCSIGFRLRGAGRATPPALRRAYSYEWRLWTIPDCIELMRAAGFAAVHVWVRPSRGGAACARARS